jgi:hypothetical protein
MGGRRVYFFVLYPTIFFTYTTSSFFAQTDELTSYKNALTQLDFSILIWKALWILSIIHCSIIKHGFWFFTFWINPLLGVNAFHINYIYGYMNKWRNLYGISSTIYENTICRLLKTICGLKKVQNIGMKGLIFIYLNRVTKSVQMTQLFILIKWIIINF